MDKNSVIFGIGLGIIAMALVFYANGALGKTADISEQEIIARAKALGMARTDDEIIARAAELGMAFPEASGGQAADVSEPPQAAETEQQPESAQTPEPEQQPEAQPEPSQPAPDRAGLTLALRIPAGATNEDVVWILRENGIITDEEAFLERLESASEGGVESGIYVLPVAGDYDRILDILLDRL